MFDVEIPLAPPLRLRFVDAPAEAARFFEAEYGRMRVETDSTPPDILVRFVDRLRTPETWESFGPSKMLADDALVIIDSEKHASICLADNGTALAEVETGMPIDVVRRRVVMSAVCLLALERDAVVMHASATCGPHGSILLLGHRGSGKTSLLVGLVSSGHEYVADDRLLLTSDCRLAPLQGMLELRLDFLVRQPELARIARGTGWRQAHAARTIIRSSRRTAKRIPARLTQRTAGALRSLEEALDAHCFFVDPREAFSSTVTCPSEDAPRVYLMSSGVPATVEPVAREVTERWLLDEAAAAYRPLFDLMSSAARVSPRWEALFENARARQREIVSSAASQLSATRVRTAPGAAPEEITALIAELAARDDEAERP